MSLFDLLGKDNPMKVEVVLNEAEFDAVVKKHTAAGRKLACVSNTGLKEGYRLTFLPASAFKDNEDEK